MNKLLPTIALAAALAGCAADEQHPTCEIATWHGFRKAAVTYTFDDGCPNQFDVAAPIFDNYGIKATFYPVGNWIANEEPLRACAAGGHEVGSHTVSHPNLAQLDPDSVKMELEESKKKIDRIIAPAKCFSIAYPYCAVPPDTGAVTALYGAARICDGFIEGATPRNYAAISSFGVGSMSNYKTAEGLRPLFEQTLAKGGWCVLLFHEIDNGPGYSPFSSVELDGSLKYLSDNDSVYWTATFEQVAKYARERDAASVGVAFVGDKMDISLTHGLGTDYAQPLTLRCTLPAGWQAVDVEQNGNAIAATVAGGRVTFDAVPNGGNVVVKKR